MCIRDSTHTVPACSSFDDVVIGYFPSDLTVINDTICIGEEAALVVTGCDNGSLLWSTGATSDTTLSLIHISTQP